MEIPLYFGQDTLSRMDLSTFSYQDKLDFYEKKQTQVEERVRKYCDKFHLMYPSCIELKDVYLECQDQEEGVKKLSPLFQKLITEKGESFFLSDIALKSLLQGRFLWLLEQDRLNVTKKENYQPIFTECYQEMFATMPRIEQQKEIKRIWILLQKEPYFCSLLRCILGKSDSLNIDRGEKFNNRFTDQIRKYRSPYAE